MEKGNKKLNTLIILVLSLLMVLILTRGISAYLSQQNIALTNKVSELVSTNQWIKYQISDKMSLDKIEVAAKERLGMIEVTNDNIKYIKINMVDIALGQRINKEDWMTLLKNNVEDIFNGTKNK